MKKSIYLLISLFILVMLITSPAKAQPCVTPPPTSTPFAEGLISARSITNTTYTSGPCLVGPEAAIYLEQGKIRTEDYTLLRAIFYDQSKATKGGTISDGALPNFNGNKIYSGALSSDVTITGGPAGPGASGVEVIFIDGTLNITGDIIYQTDDPESGLVFVVKDNINIAPTVTEIDAVLISSGTICTAYEGDPCDSSFVTTSPLVINGSLISLNPAKPIVFRRSLEDNQAQAAENINAQPKYLAILKGLFSKDLTAIF